LQFNQVLEVRMHVERILAQARRMARIGFC
jgi:hypothetical protein